MALSIPQTEAAKEEAKQYLEYSIYLLALILGVNPDELDENFVNPETMESNESRYKSFNNLIQQIQTYTAL